MPHVYKDAKGNKYQICSKCHEAKPIEDFWFDRRRNKNKRRAGCKACEAEITKRCRQQAEPIRLPAAPLLRAVEAARPEDVSWREMAEELNTTARTFFAWRHKERTVVNLPTADKIVTGLGLIWEDVFDNKTCERLRAC